jgi:hypothetical protein
MTDSQTLEASMDDEDSGMVRQGGVREFRTGWYVGISRHYMYPLYRFSHVQQPGMMDDDGSGMVRHHPRAGGPRVSHGREP